MSDDPGQRATAAGGHAATWVTHDSRARPGDASRNTNPPPVPAHTSPRRIASRTSFSITASGGELAGLLSSLRRRVGRRGCHLRHAARDRLGCRGTGRRGQPTSITRSWLRAGGSPRTRRRRSTSVCRGLPAGSSTRFGTRARCASAVVLPDRERERGRQVAVPVDARGSSTAELPARVHSRTRHSSRCKLVVIGSGDRVAVDAGAQQPERLGLRWTGTRCGG